MSKFPSFLEYLNSNGKTVEKPNVEKVADYHGPDEKNPPNSKVPYKTPVANKNPEKAEKGLSELGDEKLKYNPKILAKEYVDEKGKVLEKGVEDIKGDYKGKIPNAPENGTPYVASEIKVKEKEGLGDLGNKDLVYEPKTKTELFLNKTKGMSLSEFTNYMLKECGCGQIKDESLPFVTAYSTGKIQPHPPEAIKYIAVLADKNQGILENFVSQVISMGYLNKLMKAILEHPQAYDELTNLFNDEKDGPARCGSFVGSMNNAYSKFIADQEGLYESVSAPIGFEDEDMEDEDMEDEDMEGEDMEDEDMEDEDMEDEDMEDEDMEDEDMEDEDMEDDMEDDDMEDEDEDIETKTMPERKLKKKFAHNYLIDAMKKHKFM